MLDAALTLPILFMFPTSFVHTLKVITPSTSHFHILGKSSNVIVMIVGQTLQYFFFGACHFWLNRLFVDTLRFRAIFGNIYFIVLYSFIVFLTGYDYENVRHNLQHNYLSDVKTFISDPHTFSEPLTKIQGIQKPSEAVFGIFSSTLQDSPILWLGVFGYLAVFCIFCLYLLWRNRKGFIRSLRPGRGSRDYVRLDALSATDPTSDVYTEQVIKVFTFGAAVYALFVIWLIFGFQLDKIKLVSMLTYLDTSIMAAAQFERNLPRRYLARVPMVARSFLPKGRLWLDQRASPVFPEVHAGPRAYCAYHGCNASHTPDPAAIPLSEMPNIVLLIIESLNPSTYLISDEFIDETAASRTYISDTPFYHAKTAPHFRKLALDGVTFAGMNSLGLPTFSGWHGLMTGLTPSQNYMNIVEGDKLHVDDVASHMRDEGFRTLYVSGEDMEFADLHKWAYRRSAKQEALIRHRCSDGVNDLADDEVQRKLLKHQKISLRNCSSLRSSVERLESELNSQDFPLWFDYVETYYPSDDQADILGVPREKMVFHSWVNDRITSRQFQLHWNQQRTFQKAHNDTRPLFAGYANIEGHMPYQGYDHNDFYDPLPPGLKLGSPENRKARFLRVNKYADQYAIGETIRFLKENDPNTIVFVTGDHGSRNVPIRSKNSFVTKKTVFSGDCVGGSSGCDSIFTSTGLMSYLGTDPRIQKLFAGLKGKTLKFASDHNDLIYTMYDLVSTLRGTEMKPTHRKGRNLLDLAREMLGKSFDEQVKLLDASNWTSISFVTGQIDFRSGAKGLRMHPGDPSGAHSYDAIVYPTCLKAPEAPEMKLGASREDANAMFEFLNAQNFLTSKNRVYSYAFRNGSCIEKGHCDFPPQNVDFRACGDAVPIICIGIPLTASILIGVPLVLLFEVLNRLYSPHDEICLLVKRPEA
jgi:arylsulfatase A-like enzyme